jgi:hypothetical protein
MAKKEYHTDQTEGATPLSLIPSAFMTMGRQHIQECVRAHAQLVDKFREVNRSWLQCLRSEADLSAEFTPKMITARSIPGAATVLLEWTNRHVEMAAVDAKHVLADTQEIIEIGLRLLPGGWLFNGNDFGSDDWFSVSGLPSFISSARLLSVTDGTVLNLLAARGTKGLARKHSS